MSPSPKSLFYPLCNKYCIPPLAIAVNVRTIKPAAKTPATIGGIAFLGGKSKKFAINEPTQAPVPGNGIATKINKPKAAKFCSLSLSSIFFVALSEAQSITILKGFHLPKKSNRGLINFTIKYTGIILPIKLQIKDST